MQRNAIIIAAIVAVAAVAICLIGAVVVLQVARQPKAEPTLAPPPSLEPALTPTPAGAADDSWERIQAAGRIVVGTSADYPPFEYMTTDDQVDGFDVALMNAISRNLGISVEWHQIAFDGLVDAVRAGQIDAAIAGISTTDERQALVDFSNIYHSGEDAFLAQANSPLEGIDEDGDLSGLRVGAQRGTVYETYLQGLADEGRLSQVYRYEAALDAVRDLRQNRLGLVMMDALPAQAFVDEGGVKIAGGGLNQQLYAIALPKGATSLRDQINSALIDLQNQGVIAQLNKQYLNLDPEHILPTPTPTPPPAATNTPAPPPPCSKVLTLVKHVSYDDKNGSDPPVLSPGQAFTKTWQVRNDGTCTWDSSYRLDFASGGRMHGQPVAVQGQVEPGATYDISVDLVAPNTGGSHKGFWQMEDGAGVAFGEKLPVRIWVASPATATPPPAPTPTPGANIYYFRVQNDRRNITRGEWVTFEWQVENVQAVYFYHEGEARQGVGGEDSRTVQPPYTSNYYLDAVRHDGSIEQRSITITVDQAPDKPQILNFHVHPHQDVQQGQPVHIVWEVQSAAYVTITGDDGVIVDRGSPASEVYHNIPQLRPGQTTYTISLTAIGAGGSSTSDSRQVTMSGSLPPPPPPEDPVINSFNVTPDSVPRGDPVTLQWQTSGGTTQVKIVSGDRVVLHVNEAPLSGSHQDIPPEQEGEVPYRIIAYNAVGKHNHQVVTVTIIPPLQ
jgi:polar amino acid transport system substrate-binding protein